MIYRKLGRLFTLFYPAIVWIRTRFNDAFARSGGPLRACRQEATSAYSDYPHCHFGIFRIDVR